MELASLWDFDRPELSEQRFRAALATATGDESLILQTQIARTHGLRRDFTKAREILNAIEPDVRNAGAEARVHHAIEMGRTHASATHLPEQRTREATGQARDLYLQALELARSEHLDGLAIDAIHMLAFVDTAPAEQLRWGREALAIVESSSQPSAKRWEASIRNNVGCALHQLGRYDEALGEFERAVVLRERATDADATRVARWMVARTLRALGRTDDALAIQLRLERECEAAGTPDSFVFEELELLHRARGDAARADHYALRRATPPA